MGIIWKPGCRHLTHNDTASFRLPSAAFIRCTEFSICVSFVCVIITQIGHYKFKSRARVSQFHLPPSLIIESVAAEEEKMIEVVLNDRLGKKVRVKCNDDDTIGDLKKLVAAQTGTRADKIRIQKWYNVYKDHITLKDYEIHDGMGLELYYN